MDKHYDQDETTKQTVASGDSAQNMKSTHHQDTGADNKTDYHENVDSTDHQSNHSGHQSNHSGRNKKPKGLLKRLRRKAHRGKIAYGMLETMVGGYRAATKIGAWKEPPRDVLPKYIQAFCRRMAAAFDVTIVSVEPIPKIHALWVSNHVSWMDIPVNGSVSPAFSLSKAEVEDMPVFGRLARACGSVFINRGSGDGDAVAKQMAEFLKKGYSVMFYPEGTTTNGKKMKKIHGKLLQAAIDADKPIQPTVLCYVNSDGKLDDKIPYADGITLKQSLFQVMDSDPVTAYVLPLEPICPKGKTREELTFLLQDHMQKGLEELHNRVVTKP